MRNSTKIIRKFAKNEGSLGYLPVLVICIVSAMTQDNNWKRTAGLFLVSQSVSLFGSMLVQYAILWYVTLGSMSGGMMMLMTVLGFLPTFFMAPFAGVWADRYDRKKLIIFADAFIALVTIGLVIVYASGFEGFWPLLVASFFRSIGQGIQQPAVGAIIPQFVPTDKLARVQGIFQTISSLTMILAPITAGALMTFAPLTTIFFVDIITAAVAVIIMALFIKVPPHEKALSTEKVSYFTDLKLGFKYVREHKYLVRFFGFSALVMFLAAPVAMLSPLQVARSFGAEVWRLTAIEITFFVGMSLGGIVISAWGGFRNRIHTLAMAGFALGLFTFLMGMPVDFWVYITFMGLVGLFMPLYMTPSTVLLQEQVEPNYLGRVFGVMTMINTALMPMGMVLFGPLADIPGVTIELLLLITGAALAVIGIAILSSKILVAAGEPKPKAEQEDASAAVVMGDGASDGSEA